MPESSVVVGRADQPADHLPPLDRELLRVLLQLPVAAQRNAVYPPGHPLALRATRALHASLAQLLAERGSLDIAVARTRLVIGNAGSDPDHPMLRDLAQRLHRSEIGTLTVVPGVGEQELSELLAFIGAETARGQPAPERPAELPQWPHLLLAPPAFDQLRLAGGVTAAPESGEAKLTRLWGELATAAGGTPGDTPAVAPAFALEDPAALARLIQAQPRDPVYDRGVMRRLLALAREARGGKGAFSLAVQEQLTELLVNLPPETLFHLLSFGANLAERQSLIRDVSRAMPVGGVLEVVRASAEANQQTISNALMRIFEKLAANAEAGTGRVPAESDESLRELVATMLEGWVLQDPNPAGYTSALDQLVVAPRPVTAGEDAPDGTPSYAEPERVIQMALELGVHGSAVQEAVDQLLERGHVAVLTRLLADAPADTPVSEMIWGRLATPDLVRRLLEDGNAELLDAVLPRLGLVAAEPMLDALEIAESLTARRRLFTWLGRLGPAIAPFVLQRLDASAWYVQRNMLLLLGSMSEWPAGFDPVAYLGNPEPRVRREALKLAFRLPAQRADALCVGLDDRDEQVVGLALRTAAEGCPGRALPIILAQLDRGQWSSEVCAQFVRALATIPSPRARDWLIRRCLVRRWWLLGRRLAAKSPEVLAALSGLAATWSRDPSAAAVLSLARQSDDPDLRAAAT